MLGYQGVVIQSLFPADCCVLVILRDLAGLERPDGRS